jgi:hypothetical protein
MYTITIARSRHRVEANCPAKQFAEHENRHYTIRYTSTEKGPAALSGGGA